MYISSVGAPHHANHEFGGSDEIVMPPRYSTDGTTVYCSDDTTENSSPDGTTMVLVKSSIITHVPVDGNLKIFFNLVGSGGLQAQAVVRRNGVVVGTPRQSASSNFTEVIGGWSENDTCELWGCSTNAGQRAVLSNFRIIGSFNADPLVVWS